MSEWDGINRRNKPKDKDRFYLITLVGNGIVWLLFVASMMIFHFARPELESGLSRFWGESVRQEWDAELTGWLYGMLFVCALSSILLIFLRKQRSRRKNESTAANLIILAVVALGFLFWIHQAMAGMV